MSKPKYHDTWNPNLGAVMLPAKYTQTDVIFVLSQGRLHMMSVVDAVRLWRVHSDSVLIYPASAKEFRALQERTFDNRRRTSKGILRLLKKLRVENIKRKIERHLRQGRFRPHHLTHARLLVGELLGSGGERQTIATWISEAMPDNKEAAMRCFAVAAAMEEREEKDA